MRVMAQPCGVLEYGYRWQMPRRGANRSGRDTTEVTVMPDKPNPYREAGDALLRESGCTVRKWRKSNSGRAGTRSRDWWIEAPEPRGPISFGVFAHEIGHQMLHRNKSRPRWLEEVEAWEYALAQFERFELAGVEKSRADAAGHLAYAAHKANRRATPETAHAILARYPLWVWQDSSKVMTYLDLHERERA